MLIGWHEHSIESFMWLEKISRQSDLMKRWYHIKHAIEIRQGVLLIWLLNILKSILWGLDQGSGNGPAVPTDT